MKLTIPVLLISFLVVGFLMAAGCSDTKSPVAEAAPDYSDWRLTLKGASEMVFTLDELRNLPSVNGHGYCVSTTGFRFGPYRCKGVDLRILASMAGGMEPGDTIWISAPDGYLWVFDLDQMEGRGFVTFNEGLAEIPSPPLRIILMYEQDGKPLSYNDGGPARIAIISEEPGVITEGSAWVKWVDRIEIKEKTA